MNQSQRPADARRSRSGAGTQESRVGGAAEAESDPLAAFAAESDAAVGPAASLTRRADGPGRPSLGAARIAASPAAAPRPAPGRQPQTAPASRVPSHFRSHWGAWAAGVVVLVAAAGGLISFRPRWTPVGAAEPQPARLTVESEPAGAQVLVDNEPQGRTPLTLSLKSGAHMLALQTGTEQRVLPLMLRPGVDMTERVEFGPAAAIDARKVPSGGVAIVTDPPGARVEIDGHPRGTSPLNLSGLAPAEYKVMVSSAIASAERIVQVTPGVTTSVVFLLSKTSSPPAGWLAVSSPFDVQIVEGDTAVGFGRNSKIMLPAGRHTLALNNQALEYRDSWTIDLASGATSTVRVVPPTVLVDVNARPWADVVMNGKSVGLTPISNLALPIGAYEVVFRHPQFGERTQTVNVVAHSSNRISIDMTK